MIVREINDEIGLAGLKDEWDRVLASSASDTIFLTWEWVTAWWAAYGRPDELRIVLVFDDDGVLQGVAPLQRRTIRKYGRTYRALAFVGDGSCDSDYLDFIIHKGQEARVLKTVFEYLGDDLSSGLLLQLNEIPASSPNFPALQSLAKSMGMVWAEKDVPCSTVALPGQWDEYLKTLAPRFRTKIRSVLRNLQSQPEVCFETCKEVSELETLLPTLFDLHARRWAKEAKTGVFRSEAKRQFYRIVSPLLLERGWLRAFSLKWKSNILACQYGFTYRNSYSQLQEGYEPACEHWNVGIGLRAWSIQQLLHSGVQEYDFLAGVGRHKSDWGSEVKVSKRIVTGQATVANVLFCRGPEWIAKTRQSVKAYVPKQWLAARDARQEESRVLAYQGGQASSETRSIAPWMRSALADCYFHSPLPKLLQPARDRHQLRISRYGKVPSVTWQRRQAPSVRILYYHRVNDENDAFFPATSISMFDQQMRFVATHYKVVSLKEALTRLRDGFGTEPVVAITFDDGYADNYDNALPILQKYGLPATIFLATGSLDSREPLWFEKLAFAVQNTPLTSIDIEADIPRRIWLRDVAERLRGNDEIYAYLRGLPDAVRRETLNEFLGRLGMQNAEIRNNKMLTWTQVRAMTGKGIEFGGHTVTHPFVSKLDPEAALWEVSECKRRIEQEVQASVDHFAYPSGREQDFSAWNKDIIRQGGYQAAVSTLWGVNFAETDPMELRRGNPWEEKLSMFAAKLDWYQWVNG